MFVRFRGTYCGATNRDERPAGVDKILNAGREFVTTTSPGGDDHGFAYPAFPNRAYLKLDRIATTGADWRIHLEVGAITAEKLLSAALFDHDTHKTAPASSSASAGVDESHTHSERISSLPVKSVTAKIETAKAMPTTYVDLRSMAVR